MKNLFNKSGRKTTMAGIALILVTVGNLLTSVSKGEKLEIDEAMLGLAGAYGLLQAKDDHKDEDEAGK